MKLAIVACGRSGTRYMSKVLRAVGFDVGHERPGKYGVVDWHLAGLESGLDCAGLVWHQVRDPVAVIDSFQTVMRRTWKFACNAEPRISEMTDVLLRSMQYWLYWNQRCENLASRTYRVEQMPELLPELLGALGEDMPEGAMGRVLKVSTKDHAREANSVRMEVSSNYFPVTWERMASRDKGLTMQIREQAERYGYKFSE